MATHPSFPPAARAGLRRRSAWPADLLWLLLAALAALPAVLVFRSLPLQAAWAAPAVVALMGLAGLVLEAPAWGACGLILLIYWNASDVITDAFGFSWVLKAALLWTLGAWAFRRLLTGMRNPGRWPLLAPVAAYGLVQGLSALGAGNRAAAATALFEFVKGMTALYLVVNLLHTPRAWRRGILALLVSVLLLSLPVIFQGFTGSHNLLLGFGSMKYAEIVPGEWGWRLGGALGDPNFLALALVASLPLAAMQALERGAGWGRRGLGMAALASGLAATMYTYSRGSALGIGFIAAALAWRHRRRRLVLGWLAVMAVAALPLLPRSWLDRVRSLSQASLTRQQQAVADASIQARRNELAAGLLMFEQHPVLGVGPANYEFEYYTYSGRLGLTEETGVRDPHSLYMQIASETGLAGLLGFAWLLLAGFGLMERGRQRLRELGAHNFADQLWGLELAVATYLILSTFLHGAYFRHFLVLLGLGVGGAALALRPAPERETGTA